VTNKLDSASQESGEGVRLQKVLSQAGLGSRRACEFLIERRRVTVNGEIVREQGTRVNPESDVIHVDGERVPTKADNLVLVLNKPLGVLTTMSDDQGRPCVGDYVHDSRIRVFHVGRLDAETEGLLLLTNDGELANRLTHPSYSVDKTYIATVKEISNQEVQALTSGIELEDGPAVANKARVLSRAKNAAMVEIVIHEGRNRIVRRMFEAVGAPVTALVRTRIGPIHLGQQRPGAIRKLSGPELRSLYTAAGL
jgi:23S rRNA pseudouridine2605 synthase